VDFVELENANLIFSVNKKRRKLGDKVVFGSFFFNIQIANDEFFGGGKILRCPIVNFRTLQRFFIGFFQKNG